MERFISTPILRITEFAPFVKCSAPALDDRAALAKNPRLSSSAVEKSLPSESATAWVSEFPPTGMLRTNTPSSRAIIKFVKREPTFIIMTSFSRPQYFQAL